MSLRIFKTELKRTNLADDLVCKMRHNADMEECGLGLPTGEGMYVKLLPETVTEEAAITKARMHYIRMKKAFNGLTKRQQKSFIVQQWSDTFLQAGQPLEVRLAKRKQIISSIFTDIVAKRDLRKLSVKS